MQRAKLQAQGCVPGFGRRAAIRSWEGVWDFNSTSGSYSVGSTGTLTVSLSGGGSLAGAMSAHGDVVVLLGASDGSADSARDFWVLVRQP